MAMFSQNKIPRLNRFGDLKYLRIPTLVLLLFFITAIVFAGGSVYWLFKKDNEIEKFRRMELDLQNQIKERDLLIQQERQKIKQLEKRVEIFDAIEELSSASITEEDQWKIAKVVDEESQKYNHDPFLIVALISTESSMRPSAVSEKGARGLMQIMPSTGHALSAQIQSNPKLIGLDHHEDVLPHNLREIEDNIRIGTLYLTKLLMKYKNIEDAFCAYNMGPSKFDQLVKEGKPVSRLYASKILSQYRRLVSRRNLATGELPRIYSPDPGAPLIAQANR